MIKEETLKEQILAEFDEKFGLMKDQSPSRLASPSWKEWLNIKDFLSSSMDRFRKDLFDKVAGIDVNTLQELQVLDKVLSVIDPDKTMAAQTVPSETAEYPIKCDNGHKVYGTRIGNLCPVCNSGNRFLHNAISDSEAGMSGNTKASSDMPECDCACHEKDVALNIGYFCSWCDIPPTNKNCSRNAISDDQREESVASLIQEIEKMKVKINPSKKGDGWNFALDEVIKLIQSRS